MPRGNKGNSGNGEQSKGADFIDPSTATGTGTGGNGSGGSDGSIRDSAGTEFDPAIHSHPDSRNADGSFRRKRGRKRGSGGSKSKSKASIYSDIEKSAEMLTKGLMIFHNSLAAMTRTPELILAEEEAKGLSESGLTLMALYDVKPDPKVEAAILFAGQVGLVYGTRFVAIRARKAQEAKEKSDGTAGVYSADGTPMGTTEFKTEWPVNSATTN